MAINEEDRAWFEAYCTLIVTQTISHGGCPEYLKNHLGELLEDYDVLKKDIHGLILRARIELKEPLEDEAVKAFCQQQLAILGLVPDK